MSILGQNVKILFRLVSDQGEFLANFSKFFRLVWDKGESSLPKQNWIPLSRRLSGIEFSLARTLSASSRTSWTIHTPREVFKYRLLNNHSLTDFHKIERQFKMGELGAPAEAVRATGPPGGADTGRRVGEQVPHLPLHPAAAQDPEDGVWWWPGPQTSGYFSEGRPPVVYPRPWHGGLSRRGGSGVARGQGERPWLASLWPPTPPSTRRNGTRSTDAIITATQGPQCCHHVRQEGFRSLPVPLEVGWGGLFQRHALLVAGKLMRRVWISAIAPGHLVHIVDVSSHRYFLSDAGAAYSIFILLLASSQVLVSRVQMDFTFLAGERAVFPSSSMAADSSCRFCWPRSSYPSSGWISWVIFKLLVDPAPSPVLWTRSPHS